MTDDLIWHPYTRFSDLDEGPLPVIVRGEGPFLYGDDGTRYIDAISSWWACSLGHGHPRIIRAIQEQAATLQHSILGNLSHPPALELAWRLATLLGGDRHVQFGSDGSSAVEAALKIAVQYHANRGIPGRHAFLSLSDPYHGDTLGAVSVGYMESFHRPFKPLLFRTLQAPSPVCTTCSPMRPDTTCPAPCFAPTEALLRRHAGELAGVVVEPLCQGTAGMRMYGPSYLRRLAETCRELDILLIVDEIAMGLGRTGALFAHQHAGIDPDIVCVGKALSAGYLPISAAVVRDNIHATFSDQPVDHSLYHGHTFAGNPIAAAAAVETLQVFAEENLVERAQQLGEQMEAELSALRDAPCVSDVRCLGGIGAVELAGPDSPAHARRVRKALLAEGILLRPLGGVLYLMPPLTIPNDVLRELTHSLSAAIRTTAT